jgi:hypothetical protein
LFKTYKLLSIVSGIESKPIATTATRAVTLLVKGAGDLNNWEERDTSTHQQLFGQ